MTASDPLEYSLTSAGGYLLTFNRNYDPNGLGIEFWCNQLDGWDSPNLRQSLSSRQGSTGAVVTESFFDSRALVLNGYAWVGATDDQWAARNTLQSAAASITSDGLLEVYEPASAGGTKQCAVRLAGNLKMDPNDGTDGFAFQIPLVAADPRKYASGSVSQQSVIAGSNNVTNQGNALTYPVFVFSSQAASNPIQFTRTYDGQTMKINTSLTTSDTMVVDFLNRTVLRNGALRYDLVDGTTQWWEMFSGVTAFTSSTACVIQWRNAWA